MRDLRTTLSPQLEIPFKYPFFANSSEAFDRIRDLECILNLGPALNSDSRCKLLNEIDYILDTLQCFGE